MTSSPSSTISIALLSSGVTRKKKGCPARPVHERLWPKVDRSGGDTACWLWQASTDRHGYGQIWDSRRLVYAHRATYELLIGPIPAGLVIDHLCRVPACVNPRHLEPVTQAENMRRGIAGWNSRARTHCPQGHEYAGDNLYVKPTGGRECRTCVQASRQRYAERKARETKGARP